MSPAPPPPPALHSVVVPVFNEEGSLPELHRRLSAALAEPTARAGDSYEILLIDDGSSDRSRDVMRRLATEDPAHVRALILSRNFGQQSAISAGLEHARGDTLTVLDADLQDPPELIPDLIARWRDGFDVVYAVRRARQSETLFKRASAAAFYRLFRIGTGFSLPADTGDFRLLSRRAARAVISMPERHRFVRGMTSWIGFRQTSVLYNRAGRHAGTTKYTTRRMLRLAVDAFTSFTIAPLRLAAGAGLACLALAVVAFLWAAIYSMTRETAGWGFVASAVLFVGGLNLFFLGLLGEYVGRTFEEAKHRPLYILDELINPAQDEPPAPPTRP